MRCKLCGSNSWTPVFNVCYCNVCGLGYDLEEPEEIIEVDKVALKNYAMEQIGKIKDEVKKNYYLGVFEGYYGGLFDDRKKVREWALSRIIDLLTQLSGKRG